MALSPGIFYSFHSNVYDVKKTFYAVRVHRQNNFKQHLKYALHFRPQYIKQLKYLMAPSCCSRLQKKNRTGGQGCQI